MNSNSNLQELNEHAKRGVFNIISTLSALSPILLVLSMLALFVALGYFQYLHFAETMTVKAMAVAAAALYQLIRFGTALASIRLFSAKAYFRGGLSMIASFVLTYLESGMVTDTAAAISTSVTDAVKVNAWLIGVFVWLSWSLEMFVSVTLGAMFADDNPTVHTSASGALQHTGMVAVNPRHPQPDYGVAADEVEAGNFHDAAALLRDAEKAYAGNGMAEVAARVKKSSNGNGKH